MCTLSIVVPVYKVEKFLVPCIESIMPQLVPETELILVDDGSPDGSGQICDEYAKRNPELIHVIHQENAGVSVARNTGINRARGEWITFVDGDDLLPLNAIKTMLEYASTEASDLVVFHYMKYYDGVLSLPSESDWPEEQLTDEQAVSLYRYSVLSNRHFPESKYHGVCSTSPWAKLFRKSEIVNHRIYFMPGIKRSQDRLFIVDYMQNVKSVHLIPKVVYYYRQNEGSITVRFSADILDVLERLHEACYQTVSAFEDQKSLQLLNDFFLLNIRDAITLGAYNANCSWKRRKRIAWMKDLKKRFWVGLAENALPGERNKKWKKLIKQFLACQSTADYVLMDAIFCWELRIKPRLKKTKLGNAVQHMISRNRTCGEK